MSDIHPGFATPSQPGLALASQSDALSPDPMTASQAAELLYLSQRAERPDAYDDTLTADQAALRIAQLRRTLDG